MTISYPHAGRPVFDPRPAGLRRLPRWEDRLAAFVESRRALPFAWGSNDCCAFCADAIEAITGTRVLAVDWQPDEASAMAAIEAAGGLVTAITALLGRPGQNWKEARRGDIALAELHDGKRVPMLVMGAYLCGPGLDGLQFLPLGAARLIWRI